MVFTNQRTYRSQPNGCLVDFTRKNRKPLFLPNKPQHPTPPGMTYGWQLGLFASHSWNKKKNVPRAKHVKTDTEIRWANGEPNPPAANSRHRSPRNRAWSCASRALGTSCEPSVMAWDSAFDAARVRPRPRDTEPRKTKCVSWMQMCVRFPLKKV